MPSLPLTSPPESLCILRLSAIGDISHTLPTVRTLQAHWPDTRITWVIGKTEHALVGDIPGINFIIFDKKRGWRAYADVRRQLRGLRFDALLHMQVALRASLISLLVDAPIKLGFDRARAKDGQWLFTNHKIAPREREHVLDSLFGFAEALGVPQRTLRWDIPIPAAAHAFAEANLPNGKFIAISPCASMAYRNWTVSGYAATAVHAVRRYGMKVVLCGGPSALERKYASEIHNHLHASGLGNALTDLIGKTDLKQLLAILQRATCLISPDSGPAHLATAVGIPVIGLYACANPDRTGPYLSAQYMVNRYPDAVQNKYGKSPAELPWGVRIKDTTAMERITSDEVLLTLDRLLTSAAG
jgi:heptosyltransferase I